MASNGSGEQMIAFSTANRLRADEAGRVAEVRAIADGSETPPWELSSLFEATIEATEEAVVNALFEATTTAGRDGNTLHALPLDRTLELLERAGRLAR